MTKDLKISAQKQLTQLRIWIRWGLSKRGFWTRAFLCWLFACLILKFDEAGSYDLRFKLRGPQTASSPVVLVTIKTSDFAKVYDNKTNLLINANESNEISDSFFWDQKIWFSLIDKILQQNPKRIAVALFFGENIGPTRLNSEEILTFKDPRVYWATNSKDFEKVSLPFAARPDRSNIGHIETLKDDDGVVRRTFYNTEGLPSLAEQISTRPTHVNHHLPVINYRGPNLFSNYSLQHILADKISNHAFKDKIIIIGSEKTLSSKILTPFGELSRHEFLATLTDNLLKESFIQRLPFFIYMLFLFGLMVLCVFIITSYTQKITLFVFCWIITLWTSFSIWIFDSYFVWFPVLSPLVMMILIWVMYLGYQALRIEQAHSRLQQEQKYLADLEQLKSNFVSLISHDLKTPIAKIQAVIDRLSLNPSLQSAANEDFVNLKDYTNELNRYIQSILKVSRVESRDFKINKETADINGVIENVVERILPLAKNKKIELTLELEPMFLIEFDITLMTEVMLNLIDNAIKYTPAGGQIKIQTSESDTDIHISISDTGEGISPEDQQHIWKKFVRGRNQDLRTKGSGLGLYLVKYFIELHGGTISMKSELNKGTTFFITLPIESEATS